MIEAISDACRDFIRCIYFVIFFGSCDFNRNFNH